MNAITTEEAEMLAGMLEGKSPRPGVILTGGNIVTALRSIAAERDALQARVAELDKENKIMASLIDVIGDTFNHAGSKIFEEIKKARAALGETQ